MGKLTDKAVKAAKLEPGKSTKKLADGGGFHLLVNKSGKYWRYSYRFYDPRKDKLTQRTLALGAYPKVSLKQARELHRDATALLDKGVNPSLHKKITKHQRQESLKSSFELVSERWLDAQSYSKGHVRTIKSRLERDIIPWIGDTPISELTPPLCLEVCRKVERRGAIESARRIKSIMSQVCRFAIGEGVLESDPCRDIGMSLKTPETRNMAAVLDKYGASLLMKDIRDYQGTAVVRAALVFSALTFGRPGEIRHAEWSEIDFNENLWRIPAKKMKRKRPHIVPLSSRTVELLEELQHTTGKYHYVFPGHQNKTRPMSENGVLSALRKLGYGQDEMTAHGFRRTASTLLHEAGCPHEIIEFQLSHDTQGKVAAAYNAAQYLQDRRILMEYWDDFLLRLENDEDIPNWQSFHDNMKIEQAKAVENKIHLKAVVRMN